MRTLLLTRGTPASGKSTWITNNNLEQYSLSADKIRLLLQCPETTINGSLIISQKNNDRVWKMLMEVLEQRMERGEFIVVDATNYKSSLLSRYKKLIEKYRYRAYIIDFTSVPLDVCLERNKQRDKYKFVPESVIKKMYSVFEAEKNIDICKEISNRFTILPYDTAMNILSQNLVFDFNDKNIDKVVVFGDIHGCYEPIKNYFDKNPIQDNIQYIFTGDYLDRGIQNKEVLEFLLQNMNRKNFLYLEGNHEVHLKKYCAKDYEDFCPEQEEKKVLRKYLDKETFKNLYNNNIRSSEFKLNTIPQIQDLSKGELRQLCRKFGQMAYFYFGDKKYLITHGGLPCEPTLFTSTQEMIKGVGKYEDLDSLYENWNKNNNNCIQIHAHRNIFEIPTKVNDNIYNLCDKPEFGKNLRIIEIYKDGKIDVILEPNSIYDTKLTSTVLDTNMELKSKNDFLQQLNSSKLIQKKILKDGIVSYNFKRNVFNNRIWNDLTCKARGLFIDAKTEKIIARSYDKFFNWSEVDETKSENLKKTLKFPVYAYRKENGFLAMVSWDWDKNDLLICSKSTNEGEFVELIKDQLYKLSGKQLINLKHYLQTHNCTLVFECIDKDNDPHIIKYDENAIVLLDIIRNDFDTIKSDYTDVQFVAGLLGVKSKELAYTFNSWEELYAFKKLQDESYDIQHEGWVFEDANGFMVKYKTRFYKFWKQMRSIKQRIEKKQEVKKTFVTEDEFKVFNLLRTIPIESLKQMSIIDVEELYYNNIDK